MLISGSIIFIERKKRIYALNIQFLVMKAKILKPPGFTIILDSVAIIDLIIAYLFIFNLRINY